MCILLLIVTLLRLLQVILDWKIEFDWIKKRGNTKKWYYLNSLMSNWKKTKFSFYYSSLSILCLCINNKGIFRRTWNKNIRWERRRNEEKCKYISCKKRYNHETFFKIFSILTNIYSNTEFPFKSQKNFQKILFQVIFFLFIYFFLKFLISIFNLQLLISIFKLLFYRFYIYMLSN